MVRRITIAALVIILFFSSCKKDNPVGYPDVQIIVPSGLVTYSVFDTVIVKANVSDALNLLRVSVYITNSQNEPVLPTANIPIKSKSMSFTCQYPLNDIHLASGQYTLVVSAYNGTNTQYQFQQIYIDAAPTVRLGIYAITRNRSVVTVSKIDSNFNVSTLYSQSGDYSGSDISSYYQQLYISAQDSGNFTALSMPVGSLAWSVGGVTSPTPYFTNVYSYNDAVYISEYNNGLIKYYNSMGTGLLTSAAYTGNYPIKTAVWNNYLFVEEKSISSLTRNLVVYYAPTGAGYEQAGIPGPVVAMYGLDVSDLFVFGNDNSGAPYLELYNIPGNVFYTPISLPSAKLLSVAQIDAQTYLLGFNNGIIYTYTYTPLGIVPYINGVTAAHMQYDATDNQLIVASGKNVYEYNCTSVTLMQTATLPDSVMNVHVLYNK